MIFNPRELREMVETHGAAATAAACVEAIEDGDESARGWSLRETWEAFIGSVDETLARALRGAALHLQANPLLEEVRSQAFTDVTQAVIINQVIDHFRQVPSELDKLVNAHPSDVREETYAGFGASDGPEKVPEGGEYPETGFTDLVTRAPEPDKWGRALYVTAEAIKFDRTGMLLAQAGNLGRRMAYNREEYGLYAVQDAAASYAFYPKVVGLPTRSALYHNATAGGAWYNLNDNLAASNGLVDYANIDTAWQLMQAMVDDKGHLVPTVPNTLLCHPSLKSAAIFALMGQTQLRTQSSVVLSNLPGSVVQELIGNVNLIVSPFVGSKAGGTDTDWYIGDFKSQFQEQVIFPVQVIDLPGNPRRDIVQGWAVRRKSRVTAPTDVFVIKNTA